MFAIWKTFVTVKNSIKQNRMKTTQRVTRTRQGLRATAWEAWETLGQDRESGRGSYKSCQFTLEEGQMGRGISLCVPP